jgi:putative ABC transport system substrate-binding protein
MNRRSFLRLTGGVSSGCAIRAMAQQPHSNRQIAFLSYLSEHDPEAKLYSAAFVQGLQDAGWIVDRNLRIDFRWTQGNPDLARKYSAELAALTPDAILVAGGSHVGPLQNATRTIPIVFVQVTDPVGGGFVASLARPGANTTGFTVFEFDIGAKWLELLKQISPRMSRVAVLRDPANPSGTGLFGAMQAVAPTFNVEVSPIGLRDVTEIERGIAAFASGPTGGLVVTPSGLAIVHREAIIKAAARHAFPTTYPFRNFATSGGLMSYGPDVVDQYRHAAGYVDRILRGEKPADLPVQRSTKLDLVINLKTAKTLGLTVPQALLVRADEVIQ